MLPVTCERVLELAVANDPRVREDEDEDIRSVVTVSVVVYW